MNKHKLLLFTLIQCCFLLVVKADESPWYEIEIVVFEQSNQSRLESEQWQQPEQLANINKSFDFITPLPSSVAVKELCVNGKIIPIIEQIKVTEVIEEINENVINQTIEEAIEPFVEEKPFIILDKSFNQLNQAMSSLSRHRNYRPLIHMSWRQPVVNKNRSKLIRLFAGINYSDKFNPRGDAKVNIATLDPNSLELGEEEYQFENGPVYHDNNFERHDDSNDLSTEKSFSFHQQLEIASIDPKVKIQQQLNACQQQYQMKISKRNTDVWQIDGNIRIYAERYLHLETDLFLSIPGKKEIQLSALETSLAADKILNSLQLDNDDTSTLDNGFGWQLGDDFLLEDQNDGIVIQDVLNRYVMQQSRRLRRNETHYIDHPLFGILIQIRPYEGHLQPDNESNL